MNIHAAAVVALAALLAVGCADQPAVPTPPVAPAPPAARRLRRNRTDAGARGRGRYVQLSAVARPDDDLEFWTEATPPAAYAATFDTGETFESGPLTIRAGENVQVYSTGYLREIDVGDWASRIKGERLPDGVVLGFRRAAYGPSYRDPWRSPRRN